jgi:hypothetical protein
LAILADGVDKQPLIRKQKVKMLGIADFAFNDSDPEK